MFKHIGHVSVVSALLLATVFGQFSLTADASVYRAQASWWDNWFPFFSESTSSEVVPLEEASNEFVDVGASSSMQSGYCGDGTTNAELGEQCDDYNTTDGDGCSSSCVTEYCGDGVCGNNESASSCISDCPGYCGDGTTNASLGEQCDDYNTTDGDGCSAACMSEYCGDGTCGNGETTYSCPNDCPAVCGNWSTEGAETCDDGNTNDGDGCTSSCQSEYCGDGTCNNNETSAACPVDCPSVCGDWTTAGTEACDDGNTNDNDGCSANCAVEYCGDTIVQAGEECDDGNTDSTDACVSCKLAACGDGQTYYGYEECDDGASNSDTQPDACRTTCKRATCGDNVQDANEACDDGNLTNDDGCSWLCENEDIYCGDGKVQGAEQCDPGTKCRLTGVDCRPGVVACPGGDDDVCEFEKNTGCDYGCSLICGNGVIDEGETCDLGSACEGTGVDCSAVENRPCEGGVSCVAASRTLECYFCQKAQYNAAPSFSALSQSSANYSRSNSSGRSSSSRSSADIWSSVCGNTIKEAGEECDDGNAEDGDGCSWLCTKEGCGDGLMQTGEECDPGAKCSISGVSCLMNEGCLGGVADVCMFPAGSLCSMECKRTCGNGVIDAGELCDRGSVCQNSGANCTQKYERSCADGSACVVLDEADDGCTSTCQLEACGNGVVDAFEDCDPGLTCTDGRPCHHNDPRVCAILGGIAKPDDCKVRANERCTNTCRTNTCGNGSTEPANGEDCDDGNNQAGDGCSEICKREYCGNGTTDVGEECDAGKRCLNAPDNKSCMTDGECGEHGPCVTMDIDGCSYECKWLCGDTLIYPGEDCDDGNRIDGDGCSSDCKDEYKLCGNGTPDPGEDCDDGNRDAADDCTNKCRYAVCGDGDSHLITSSDTPLEKQNPIEQCDDGNLNNGDGCDNSCFYEECGNGRPQSGEECDAGLENSDTRPDACRTDCIAPRCGDKVKDSGEDCDNGVNDGSDGCFDCLSQPCGDGKKTGTEECDDGNTFDGDGCNSRCDREWCGNEIKDSGEECDLGKMNGVEGSDCTYDCKLKSSFCGDRIVDANEGGGEECDDGGDGSDDCTPTCKRTIGTCGNKIKEGIEECDDGNLASRDGCLNCYAEKCGNGVLQQYLGEYCDEGKKNNNVVANSCRTDCTAMRCGDSIPDPGEECDDGNLISGDGCDKNCESEVFSCGDGEIQTAESCDDGNMKDGDGCSRECGIEYGYYCNGMPSSCATKCGDTQTAGLEECDDGNANDNDGCTIFCSLEYCGDGVTQSGEQCDPGAKCTISQKSCRPGANDCLGGIGDVCHIAPATGCDFTCSLLCGNGKSTDSGEQCDNGSVCQGTNIDCTFTFSRPCANGLACVRKDDVSCQACQRVVLPASPNLKSPFIKSGQTTVVPVSTPSVQTVPSTVVVPTSLPAVKNSLWQWFWFSR